MSFFDLLSPWATIDAIEADIAATQAALDAALAAKAAQQNGGQPAPQDTVQTSPVQANSAQPPAPQPQLAVDPAAAQQTQQPIAQTVQPTQQPVPDQAATQAVAQPTIANTVQTTNTVTAQPSQLTVADYQYLNPYMVEFVAQSVMASMQGISPDLTLAVQKTTIDTMLKNNAFVQAYTPDQLLQVGIYFTQAYLAQSAVAPAGVPLGSAIGAQTVQAQIAPVQTIQAPTPTVAQPIAQPVPVAQLDAVVVSPVTVQPVPTGALPIDQPLPINTGLDFTGVLLFAIFCGCIYWGLKQFKKIKAREGQIKFNDTGFGEGFL